MPARRRAVDFFKDEEEHDEGERRQRVTSHAKAGREHVAEVNREKSDKEHKKQEKGSPKRKREKDSKHKHAKKRKAKHEKKGKQPKPSKEKELEIERRLAKDDTRSHTMKWVTDINK